MRKEGDFQSHWHLIRNNNACKTKNQRKNNGHFAIIIFNISDMKKICKSEYYEIE